MGLIFMRKPTEERKTKLIGHNTRVAKIAAGTSQGKSEERTPDSGRTLYR